MRPSPSEQLSPNGALANQPGWAVQLREALGHQAAHRASEPRPDGTPLPWRALRDGGLAQYMAGLLVQAAEEVPLEVGIARGQDFHKEVHPIGGVRVEDGVREGVVGPMDAPLEAMWQFCLWGVNH